MFVRMVVIAFVAVLLWAVFARDTGAGSHPEYHTVRAGDTLWSISVAGYAGDPREGVWLLQQRNGLDGATIHPGQRLLLP